MSDVLAPEQRTILAGFARSRVLLAFDFDGTLAPIVDHPRDAAVREETRTLLHRLSKLYPCVVISGRLGADVRKRLVGTGIRRVVGNHGAELAPALPGLRKRVAGWSAVLESELTGLEGTWIENKVLSLAVHYRKSPDKLAAKRRIWRTVPLLEGARATPAKQAVNIVSVGAPNKGAALDMERLRLGCERVIFVGDDQTDEDVFCREWHGALFGVSVGRRKSAACYQLHEQREIDRFLLLLAELREPADSRNPNVKFRAPAR